MNLLRISAVIAACSLQMILMQVACADGTYNREAAVKYALAYGAKGRANQFYRRYSASGGDCTNFVSQVLRFGGWSYANGSLLDQGNPNTWWYDSFGPGLGLCSDTWSNADDLFLFLLRSGRAHLVSDPAQLSAGDVVQMIWSYAPDQIGHTAVIDLIGNDGTIYFAQHDDDTLDDTFSKYIDYNPGVKFLYWHIDDRYPSSDPIPFFRYYNPQLDDHFYTSNWSEVGGQAAGYTFEKVECELSPWSVPGTTTPLYRYSNPSLGDHFYTANWNELGSGAAGYSFENIVGYVYTTAIAGTRPLYRYCGINSGHHFYTTNPGELAGRSDFRYEGVVGYVLP